MNRLKIIVLSFAAMLPLAGCKTSTPTQQPASITSGPPSQAPVPDAKREQDERKKRDADIKRRRNNSTDIDKTGAYRNYVP